MFKWLECKTIVLCLKLRAKLRFKVFYSFMALSRITSFKLGLFCMKPCKQHNLVYIIVLKWLELKTIIICLKLYSKLRILPFFKHFSSLSNEVVQTRMVWRKLGTHYYLELYYCV